MEILIGLILFCTIAFAWAMPDEEVKELHDALANMKRNKQY